MQDYQFWTMVGLMAAGFGWMITWLRSIDSRLNSLENKACVLDARIGFIERLLEMLGIPSKSYKERTDP